MPERFQAAAKRIEANPLGRLMYGQRELFHSNLIGWFFDELPEAADATFRPLTVPGEDSGRWVERERGHMDLVFHWPDRAPLVVENKVFALPDREQLERYEQETERWRHSSALILLSVSPPDFDSGAWRYLSYAEFSARLLAALPSSSSYEIETMRRYAALVRDLHELISAVDIVSDAEPVWLASDVLGVISSSQMRAALHKARAQRVAKLIGDTIPAIRQEAKGGMTNATPLAETLEYVHTNGLHVHLGWQLQGDQFRRAVIYHSETLKGRSDVSRSKREEVSREHPEFFSFPEHLPQLPNGRKEFNHYAPDFVYKYVKVPGMTVADLKTAAATVHGELERLRAG